MGGDDRELRHRASRFLQLVRAGQRVAVTDRVALVAYLVRRSTSSG